MSTSLKKIKIVAIIIIIAWMLSVILQGTCVKAASKTLRKTDKTTYAIATTSGELCSTTVSTFLTENVDKKSSKKAIYNNRSACIWHEDATTWAKIKIGISSDAYHINGSKTVKKFTWKNENVLHTSTQKVVHARRNKTSCTYSPTTKVQLRIGYSVNATDAVLVKSKVVKLNLKY